MEHRGRPWKCPTCRTTVQAVVLGAAVAATVALTGCTQAFVEVRQDRHSQLTSKPDAVLSIGARWYFWDAYGQWLADKLKEAK